MTFQQRLSFILMFALAFAAALYLPDLTGWRAELVSLVAFATLAGAALAHFLVTRERDTERLDRVEKYLETVRRDIEDLRSETGAAGAKSEDLVQEMRVLQRLLGEIVGRGGTGKRRSAKKAADSAAATKPAATARKRSPSAKPARDAQDDELLNVVRNALSANRVDLYVQPTVSLPSRRMQHFECFSRVRDEAGTIIYPSDFLPLAESSGLIGTLDNLLLFRCIQLVRRLGARRPEVRFFCNISSSSVHDEEFFPQFIDYMLSNRDLGDRLVFEFAQADLEDMSLEMLDRLAGLGHGGYALAMDHVTDLRLDPSALAERHIAYVKIDADLLLSGESDLHPRDLRDLLWRHRIALIASKVEDEAQVLELLEQDIEYAQGYLFGAPRLSREEAGARHRETVSSGAS